MYLKLQFLSSPNKVLSQSLNLSLSTNKWLTGNWYWIYMMKTKILTLYFNSWGSFLVMRVWINHLAIVIWTSICYCENWLRIKSWVSVKRSKIFGMDNIKFIPIGNYDVFIKYKNYYMVNLSNFWIYRYIFCILASG